MRNILTFGSLGLTLAATLLLGPLWGAGLGLLAYVAGSNVLLMRESQKLKAQLHKSFNDLPDLVSELVKQRLQELGQAEPASPPPKAEQIGVAATGRQTEPAPVLEQRLSALDSKFEILVQLLTTREQQALPIPAEQAKMAAETAEQPPSAEPEQATATDTRAGASEHNADLAAMRELLGKMAAMLAPQGEAIPDDKEAPAAPREVMPNASTLAPRPTVDELRAELNKLALELRSELDRPQP